MKKTKKKGGKRSGTSYVSRAPVVQADAEAHCGAGAAAAPSAQQRPSALVASATSTGRLNAPPAGESVGAGTAV